jgi:hypothetical protein
LASRIPLSLQIFANPSKEAAPSPAVLALYTANRAAATRARDEVLTAPGVYLLAAP